MSKKLRENVGTNEIPDKPNENVSVVEVVLEASRALVAVAARSLVGLDADITLAQYRAMVVLNRRPGLTVSDLAEELLVSSSTVTRLCDRLVRKGLIRRQRSRGDRRQTTIFLSSFGRQLISEVTDRRREELGRILSVLSFRQQREIVEALSVFTEVAEKSFSANPTAPSETVGKAPSSFQSTTSGTVLRTSSDPVSTSQIEDGERNYQEAANPEVVDFTLGDLRDFDKTTVREWPI